MMKIYRDSKGRKLYPVCSWMKNQHKLYNAHDIVMNAIYDEPDNAALYDEQERIEKALAAFDEHVDCNGIVYATYQDSCIIKDIIAAYDLRHN